MKLEFSIALVLVLVLGFGRVVEDENDGGGRRRV
jgi:hypothetical protein